MHWVFALDSKSKQLSKLLSAPRMGALFFDIAVMEKLLDKLKIPYIRFYSSNFAMP